MNPRGLSQIVQLTRHVNTGTISSFHKTYLEWFKDPLSYLFFVLTSSINDIQRFRTKILPGETTEVFAYVQEDKPVTTN